MDLLSPELEEAAARTLTAAFVSDPLMELIAPDPKKRPKVGPWFMGRSLAYGLRWGRVYANEDASAVAVWFPPGQTTVSPIKMLRVGMWAMPFKLGMSGTRRFLSAMPVMEKWHKAVEGPHWYLMAIGTDPSKQGQGLGSALMEVVTAQADAAGVPCYLETGTDSNVAFYSKRGFEVTGEAIVHGLKLSGMVRQPR